MHCTNIVLLRFPPPVVDRETQITYASTRPSQFHLTFAAHPTPNPLDCTRRATLRILSLHDNSLSIFPRHRRRRLPRPTYCTRASCPRASTRRMAEKCMHTRLVSRHRARFPDRHPVIVLKSAMLPDICIVHRDPDHHRPPVPRCCQSLVRRGCRLQPIQEG